MSSVGAFGLFGNKRMKLQHLKNLIDTMSYEELQQQLTLYHPDTDAHSNLVLDQERFRTEHRVCLIEEG
jgi:hypothetical protein